MNDRYMTADQKARLWRFCIITGVIVTFLTIAIVMVGCPQYNKYRKDKAGEGALLEAESAKLVQLEEAKANLDQDRRRPTDRQVHPLLVRTADRSEQRADDLHPHRGEHPDSGGR
jgi:hypothetical protein